MLGLGDLVGHAGAHGHQLSDLGFMVWGFRIQNVGFRVYDLGVWVVGLLFRL